MNVDGRNQVRQAPCHKARRARRWPGLLRAREESSMHYKSYFGVAKQRVTVRFNIVLLRQVAMNSLVILHQSLVLILILKT